MVRMKNEHVVGVVDDTLTIVCEVPNQVNEGAWSTRGVEPGLSQDNHLIRFCLLVSNSEDLVYRLAKCMT